MHGFDLACHVRVCTPCRSLQAVTLLPVIVVGVADLGAACLIATPGLHERVSAVRVQARVQVCVCIVLDSTAAVWSGLGRRSSSSPGAEVHS